MRILSILLSTLFCVTSYSPLLAQADIAVVTLVAGDKYKKTVSSGVENKRLYCQQHGYDFICGGKSLDRSRPIPWTKILIILQTMENSNYQWIFWTDADSLIMNMSFKLEDFIQESENNLILTKDISNINTGEFFIRNCEWSRNFLKAVYGHTECINDAWWEQQGLINELEKNPEWWSLIEVIPQRLINSYISNYEEDDFIIHFAGVHNPKILKGLMEKYANKSNFL